MSCISTSTRNRTRPGLAAAANPRSWRPRVTFPEKVFWLPENGRKEIDAGVADNKTPAGAGVFALFVRERFDPCAKGGL